MKNTLKADESTKAGPRETHHKVSFDPMIGTVPILDENEATDTGCLLDRSELEALTSWTYFEPLQFR